MKQNGQIFSLDFLISLALVILAIGMAMQFLELKEYETKDYTEQMELERIGNTAAELLVSNPEIVCELTDNTRSTVLGHLQNCIPKINSEGDRIKKGELGIPAGFECWIYNDNDFRTDCIMQEPDASVRNIFSAQRKIVFYKHTGGGGQPAKKKVTKGQLEACLNGSECDLIQQTVTLKVWKE